MSCRDYKVERAVKWGVTLLDRFLARLLCFLQQRVSTKPTKLTIATKVKCLVRWFMEDHLPLLFTLSSSPYIMADKAHTSMRFSYSPNDRSKLAMKENENAIRSRMGTINLTNAGKRITLSSQ